MRVAKTVHLLELVRNFDRYKRLILAYVTLAVLIISVIFVGNFLLTARSSPSNGYSFIIMKIGKAAMTNMSMVGPWTYEGIHVINVTMDLSDFSNMSLVVRFADGKNLTMNVPSGYATKLKMYVTYLEDGYIGPLYIKYNATFLAEQGLFVDSWFGYAIMTGVYMEVVYLHQESFCTIPLERHTIDSGPAPGDVGQYSSLALDSSGYAHISYYDVTGQNLKYAWWNGSAWRIEAVDSVGDVGQYSSLALDSNGYPHISYYDATNSNLKYAKWDDSAWTIGVVDSVGDVGQYCSLALDSGGYPRISYYDATNSNLKYAEWNGSAWTIEVVDSGDVGQYSSLALDSSGYPHISYYNVSGQDLKYAGWNGSAWTIGVVDSVGDVGQYCSLALDSGGYPHISYHDATNSNLKYAWWNGTVWDVKPVDGAGKYSSLALDSSGCPHISYQGSYLRLRYAAWTGEAWSIQEVDTTYSSYTSVALDSGGCPHISYYDLRSQDLKYAKWTGLGLLLTII